MDDSRHRAAATARAGRGHNLQESFSMPSHSLLSRRFGLTPRTGRSPVGRRPRLEALEDRLAPATLTVNSTADTASSSDPYLSLREAIAIVNSPTLPTDLSQQILDQISGTLHSGGADTIRFNSGVVSIILGGTQLELSLPGTTAAVAIEGGTGVTVDAASRSRALQVDSGVQLTLDHLTLSHGSMVGSADEGGGILNAGTLTVTSTTLSANTGYWGGGIANEGGTLTVTSSTLSHNSARVGGGIYHHLGSVVGHASLTVNPAAAVAFQINAPAAVTAGQSWSMTVAAVDPYGNIDTNYVGSFHLGIFSEDPDIGDSTFLPSDHGLVSFTGFALYQAGVQTIVASGDLYGQANITVNPDVAAFLVLNGPSNATAGTPFPVTVIALDAYGNVATGYLGTVTFSCDDAAATLPNDYQFQPGDQGAQNFQVTLGTPGMTWTVTVTDTSNSSLTASLNVTV
jgi:hypothetical protein